MPGQSSRNSLSQSLHCSLSSTFPLISATGTVEQRIQRHTVHWQQEHDAVINSTGRMSFTAMYYLLLTSPENKFLALRVCLVQTYLLSSSKKHVFFISRLNQLTETLACIQPPHMSQWEPAWLNMYCRAWECKAVVSSSHMVPYSSEKMIKRFWYLLGSALAAAKASATLPGVHMKHIHSIEHFESRTEIYTFKMSHIAYISVHTHHI
jgi:hypothetical protein